MRLKPIAIVGGIGILVAVAGTLTAREAAKQAASSAPSASAKRWKKPAESETKTYESLLGDLDRRVEGLQKTVNARRDDDWIMRSTLAGAILERATLTNQVDDFERAQKVVDEAFAAANGTSGPIEVGVRFNFTVHRLDAAEQLLDRMDRRPRQKTDDRIFSMLFRAQIAMQRGEYAAAFEGLSTVAVALPAIGNPELALYYAKTGEGAQAEALLIEALEGTDPKKDPRLRAWLRLQHARIAMDRGAYREALDRLKEADAELPGWWMVEEQVAEAYTALGEKDKAIAAYQSVVDKTGLPQAMDSLASAYQHAGQNDKAQPLIDKAAALWADHIKRMPEASMGHGLHHYLQFGPADKALELALINYAARPGLESPVLLARAYLKVGKNAEALEVAKKALATPYRSASVHDVASKAYAALGDTANADAEREKCFAINPWYQDQLHSH